MRQTVERKIARKLIKDALVAGYSLGVNNGGDEDEIGSSTDAKAVLNAMFATDQDHLIFYRDNKRIGWALFVYGNDGWDVISDYTTNLEAVMAGAQKISEQYQ